MKKTSYSVTLMILFLFFVAYGRLEASVKVTDLKCENLTNPNAIDNTTPHFSWKIKSDQLMQQQGYEIQVTSDTIQLMNGSADLWNSGKINSSSSVMVPYKGKALTARSLCYWRIRVWNDKGEVSDWTPIARFGIGILDKSNIKGSFIGLESVKTPILRHKFTITGKNITFLHVNSLGYHEVYINGKKVSEDVLSPAVSQLNKRSMVVTYDVTPYIQEGENELVILLGQGWYKKTTFGGLITVYDGPLVRSELDVLKDGTWNTLLVSDSSWKGIGSGYSDTGTWMATQFGGEQIDAAKNPADLLPATLDQLSWIPAITKFVPLHEISPEMCEPNRIQETITAKTIKTINSNTWLVDMGKALTGWFELYLPLLSKGTTITMEYCDILDKDGNLVDQGQKDLYVVSGNANEVFRNKFDYHGFRYVKISNLPQQPKIEDIKAYLIHNNYKVASSFVCSDTDLNAIHNMIQYTMRCLAFGGYMSDCPHYERSGYGGDGNSSTETLQTMYDVSPLFTNWLQCWGDAMRAGGSLPHVAPNPGAGGGGPYWCGFMVMAPWRTYVNYNDPRLIEKYYPAMKEWINYVDKYSVGGLLKQWPNISYRSWYLGDWLPPDGVDAFAQSSVDLVNNCFISDCFATLEKIANVLGKPEEAQGWADRRNNLNQLLHSAYYNSQNTTYSTGSQIDVSYPMLVGVTPKDIYPQVKNQLFIDTDVKQKGHIGVGLVGVPVLTKWAIENKAADFIYTMLKKRDYPGYLHMIDQSATTTWESWNGDRSHIHNCYNGIGSWFYQAVGGIRTDENNPGYKHVFIEPQIPKGVSWAKTTKETPYGTIKVDWQLVSDSTLNFNVALPVGSRGTVILPEKIKSCVIDGIDYVNTGKKIELINGILDTLATPVPIPPKSVKLEVYPNPTTKMLYINSDNLDIKTICIYDMSGTKIKEIKNVENSIDVSFLSPGVYFIRLCTGELNQTVYEKIIKL